MGECQQHKQTQQAPPTKTECNYFNGRTKERSHMQKAHPKWWTQRYSWGTLKKRKKKKKKRHHHYLQNKLWDLRALSTACLPSHHHHAGVLHSLQDLLAELIDRQLLPHPQQLPVLRSCLKSLQQLTQGLRGGSFAGGRFRCCLWRSGFLGLGVCWGRVLQTVRGNVVLNYMFLFSRLPLQKCSLT